MINIGLGVSVQLYFFHKVISGKQNKVNKQFIFDFSFYNFIYLVFLCSITYYIYKKIWFQKYFP